MAVIRKYEFELSFDPPSPAQIARRRAAEAARAQAEAEAAAMAAMAADPPPPPEPTYSLAELQAAEQAARDQAYQEGAAEAQRLIEARMVEASEALRAQMHGIAQRQAQTMADIEHDAAHLTLLALRKLFPVCLAAAGTRETEALLTTAFRQALEEPRLLIRCAPDMREALEPAIQRIAALAGFEGKLSIIADPALTSADCRIEWAEGGIERDTRKFLAAIESLIGGILPQGGATAALSPDHAIAVAPEPPGSRAVLEETTG